MPISISEFWRRATNSRLLSEAQCQLLASAFSQVKGASKTKNALALAHWLVAENAISGYQSKVLLASEKGRFVFGDYKVYDPIPSGRLSGMFRAVHIATGHPVLLSLVDPSISTLTQRWPIICKFFFKTRGFRHNHVASCFDLIDLGTFHGFIFEDAPGQTLEELLTYKGSLRPADACRMMRQAALGLAALHKSGSMHGHVRPENLWVDNHLNVKVMIDPLWPPEPVNMNAPDPTGKLLAHADYMAPELGDPTKAPDVLTDVYSLGCALYQLLAGEVPFPGGDMRQKLARHATERIRPLDQVAGVAQTLSQLVAYAMAKDQKLRFKDAAELGKALEGHLDQDAMNLQSAPASPTLQAYEAALQQGTSIRAIPLQTSEGP